MSACAAAPEKASARAAQHPVDVHVARQHVLAEREVPDGCGRIRADAGEHREILGPAVCGHVGRRAVERERPSVVPEALPLDDHLGGRRGRERLDRRPALEPAPVARNDPVDLRLLEHHLADEDGVRVPRVTPREVAAGAVVPRQEEGLHGGDPTGPGRLHPR